MMNARMVVTLIGVILLFGGCAESVEKTAEAARQPANADTAVTLPALPISMNAVMMSLIDHASHEIWNAPDKQKTPPSAQDWTELEHHALQLAASGALIMLPGSGAGDKAWGQGSEWKKYSRELSDAGLAAVDAARRKDMAGIMAAGNQLVDNCEGCHKVYKKDMPAEGLVHPHYR